MSRKSRNLFDKTKIVQCEYTPIQRVGITLEQYKEYLKLIQELDNKNKVYELTAKEMFEELGFILVDFKYNNFICYELNYKINDIECKECVDFKIKDSSVSLYRKINNKYGSFNVDNNNIFKAIQKQIEELRLVNMNKYRAERISKRISK